MTVITSQKYFKIEFEMNNNKKRKQKELLNKKN